MHTAFIVCGTPGSGKTTYARRLAADRRATLLDIDTVTERLVRIALAESGLRPDSNSCKTYRIIISGFCIFLFVSGLSCVYS